MGYEKLLKSSFNLLASMVNPDAKGMLMLSLVKQMVCLFVVDNYLNNPAHLGADSKTLEELVARVIDL
jgi:hypothetical protein